MKPEFDARFLVRVVFLIIVLALMIL